MTYTDLKDDLYLVREKEKILRSKRKSLLSTRDEYLARLNSGVTDYAKDNLQKSRDPDASIINTLYEADKATAKLVEEIKQLQDETERYEALVIGTKGISGEILRLFFIEGHSTKHIGKRLGYSERSVWRLWRQGIKELLEVINNEQKENV